VKYLIVELDGIPQAAMFSETFSHAAIADGIQSQFRDSPILCEIVSAGFFEGSAFNVEVFGSSDSLSISSRPEDAEIIATEFQRRSIRKPKLQSV
jgi:hypothetical protein